MDDKLELNEDDLEEVSGGVVRGKQMKTCPICQTKFEDNPEGCPTCAKRKKASSSRVIGGGKGGTAFI